ncbi:MAG TPA: tRNA (adenosine(37)-N6)-threonylcarbamoyltransferase complex ATPase subunit type 1 TsaE [Bacteroidales bacterium]|nr:tRNA (adenosine(37)-N6)-threonylcarbamoyltransferase complex ATPase subunit type 1 TsaE [Bacteroidales bacterium]
MKPFASFGISDVQQLDAVAALLAGLWPEHNIFAFYGPMGAGKTTLIKELCKHWGVESVVSSPTFALVNEYENAEGHPVYHFDFYRIEKLSEVFDMGYEEYFFSDNPCLIEWPEKIGQLLPEDCVKVHIVPGQLSSDRCIEVYLPAQMQG